MELTSYCDSLADELRGWKAKVDSILAELDNMPSGDKEKVVPQVNELHGLAEQLVDRIERLKRDCTDEWAPDRIEMDSILTHAPEISEETWPNVSGADVGG